MKRTKLKINRNVEGAPSFVQADDRTHRIYFAAEIYIQRRVEDAARKGDSYYDRHRIAKGETDEIISDVISLHGVTMDALFAALSLAFGGREVRYRDEISLWDWAKEAALGSAITTPVKVTL